VRLISRFKGLGIPESVYKTLKFKIMPQLINTLTAAPWNVEACQRIFSGMLQGKGRLKLPLVKRQLDGVLVGYPEKEGCFFASPLPEDAGLCVQLFPENKPGEVADKTFTGQPSAMMVVEDSPNWGMTAVAVMVFLKTGRPVAENLSVKIISRKGF
jgi:hypothetical protein